MTILELFKQANLYNLVVIYEKLFPYEEYDYLMSRNIKNVIKQTNGLVRIVNDIITRYHQEDIGDENDIVYVIENESQDLDDKTTSFEVFTLQSKDIETINDFYSNRSEIGFGTEFEKNNILVNKQVFEKSINTYGIDICAANILHSLILFGYGEKHIQGNIEKIIKQLDKAEKDIKAGRVYTAEEVFDRLKKDEMERRKSYNEFDLAIVEAYDLKRNRLKKVEKQYRKLKEEENLKHLVQFIKE